MNDQAQQLLIAIAAGKQEAMTTFYQRFHRNVYRFALKIVKDPNYAAEILNEVMMEVWRKADTFSGQSKVNTWVLSITRNKAIDLLRKQNRHQADDIDDIEIAEESCSFSRAVEGAQNSYYIKQCLDTLSAEQKYVIHLTFFEELSYPEIAKTIDCPEGTVKTRMLHAKKRLKQCLSRLMGKSNH